MPNKVYVHTCNDGREVRRGGEICFYCGKPGVYDGWGYSMIERMCMYSRSTGMGPIGPHRPFADKLISPRLKPCPQCGGKGLLDINQGQSYRLCSKCDGAMDIFDGTPKELEDLRRQVREAVKEQEARRRAGDEAGPGYTGGSFMRPQGNLPQASSAAAEAMAAQAQASNAQGGALSRVEDKSLEAYKSWITGITEALGGQKTMTEEEWRESWLKFWAKEDK